MSKIVKKKDLDVLIESTMSKAGIKKPIIKEEMVGPVNYDDQIAAELKAEVGNLDKLTPYVLAKGDGKMDVQMGADGKVHLTDVSTKKKVGLYKNVDDFLRGIGYQMKIESTSSNKSLIKEDLDKFNKLINYKF